MAMRHSRHGRSRAASIRRLSGDRLEQRRLLATFQFFGTGADDRFDVVDLGSSIFVSVNGGPQSTSVPDLAATRIEIFALGGADRINVESTGSATVVVDAGDSDDLVSIAYDMLPARLDVINGPLQLIGGFGDDFLVVGDATHTTSSGPVVYSVSPTSFDRFSPADATPTHTYSGFERFALVTASTEPTQTFLANGTTEFELFAGGFDDELYLSPINRQVATDIDALVTFNAGNGIDRVIVDDASETARTDWVIQTEPTIANSVAIGRPVGNFGELLAIGAETFRVLGGSGRDTFDIDDIPLAPLSFDIRGNDNDDAVHLGRATGVLSNIPTRIRFDGNAGVDRFTMQDGGNAAPGAYDFNDGIIDYPGFGSATLDTVEAVVLDAGTGASTIDIRRTLPGVSTTVRGGFGPDTLTVGGGNYQAGIRGAIVIDGQGDGDTLRIDDTQDTPGNDVFGVTSTSVAKPTLPATTYAGMEALVINGGTGNDTIDLFSVVPIMPVTVTGGSGNDAIRIGSGLDGRQALFRGGFHIDGGPGADALSVHNPGSTTDELYLVTSDEVALVDVLGLIEYKPVDYVNTESLLVNDGAGDSAFVLNSSLPGTSITVRGNDGDDDFFNSFLSSTPDLGPIDGPVLFVGGAGTDGVELLDTLPGSDTYQLNGTNLTRTGFGGLAMQSFESLSLRAQSGDNFINVVNTPAGVDVRLLGGAGADTFDIQSTTSAGDYLRIDGEAGLDNVVVNSGGSIFGNVEFAASQDLDLLDVRANGRLRVAPGFTPLIDVRSISVAGVFDLGDGSMVARGNALVPGQNYFRTRLANGYAGGTWAGAQPAIVSGVAAATPTIDHLGYARAGDIGTTTFAGTSVAPNDLLMRRTLPGDTDLNRTVNFTDLLRFAEHYRDTSTTKFWWNGDSNYNGVVDFTDLLLFAEVYRTSLPSLVSLQDTDERERLIARVDPPTA
jgi:hypothetical protein